MIGSKVAGHKSVGTDPPRPEKVCALCLDASRCAARRRADLGPFLRSAHWRSLYLTPVVRPFRRYFPGKAEGMATVFAGAALAALAANSALATATSRSSSTPCSSRSVCAVHVGRRLRHACSCGHALPGMPAARADPSLCIRWSMWVEQGRREQGRREQRRCEQGRREQQREQQQLRTIAGGMSVVRASVSPARLGRVGGSPGLSVWIGHGLSERDRASECVSSAASVGTRQATT